LCRPEVSLRVDPHGKFHEVTRAIQKLLTGHDAGIVDQDRNITYLSNNICGIRSLINKWYYSITKHHLPFIAWHACVCVARFATHECTDCRLASTSSASTSVLADSSASPFMSSSTIFLAPNLANLAAMI
jgi:hypothetical protein